MKRNTKLYNDINNKESWLDVQKSRKSS